MYLHQKTKEPAIVLTKRWIDSLREKGLFLVPSGTYSSVLPLLMPLAITDEQIEKGISIIGEGLAEIA
jgi:4-aminobutyrate aminotransferase-like enzyme